LRHTRLPQTGVPTGFKAIDRVTQGWQPSDLILVAARPSIGNTAFGLSMARNMAVDHEQRVAFFSPEMSATHLMMRLLAIESGLSCATLRSGKNGMTSEQWEQLELATKPLGTAPLYIDDTPALSVLEFRSAARQLKMRHDVKVIIIDYLQLMTGGTDTKNGNREQEVAFILRTLKEIATELKVPIIVFTHTRKTWDRPRPQLSDLRDSGVPIEYADMVAFIHRPEYYGIHEDENGIPTDGLAEFIIAKRRNGAACTVNLRFLKEQVRFIDPDDIVPPPSAAIPDRQACDEHTDPSNSGGGN